MRAVREGLAEEVMFEQKPARKKSETVGAGKQGTASPEMSHSVCEEIREARMAARGPREGRAMEMRSGL